MADSPPPKAPPPRRPSGKQRAVRIPLDYFKKRDGLGRVRLALVVLAPTLALGWWYGDRLLRGDRADRVASHGPIWAGHATWEDDCTACHAPFEPIRSDAAFARRGSSRLAGSDRRCMSCHLGPIHHAGQDPSKSESCGGCHRDHRGRDADLNRVPDSQCTICHADLPHAFQGGPPEGGPAFLDVSRFDLDHPEFAIRAPADDGPGALLGRRSGDGTAPGDPSNLKFNHARHLAEGIDSRFTFADLEPEDRPRFGWTSSTPLEAPVRLDCASCHRLDRGDRPAGLAESTAEPLEPSRSAGEYMLPVSFERDCRACHPLTVGAPGADREPLEVPHRLQPAELRRFLHRAFAAEVLDADRSILDRPAGAPGDADEAADRADRRAVDALRELLSEAEARPPGRPRAEPTTIGDALDQAIRGAERTLYLGNQTCTECHRYAEPKGEDPSGWSVLPTRVPEVWFPHARFSHVAHRAVDCDQCHGGARGSTVSDDVLMPAISTCRQCHAPAEYRRGDLVRGGARFDCVECHRYHDGDRPMQGVGALARQVDPEHRRSIEAFLRGSSAAPGTVLGPPEAD